MQHPNASSAVSTALSWAESEQPESSIGLNELGDEPKSHARTWLNKFVKASFHVLMAEDSFHALISETMASLFWN